MCRLLAMSKRDSIDCGRSSGVERHLAKVKVEGSNPFARSNFFLEGPIQTMRSLFILSTLLLVSLGMAASAQPVPAPATVSAPAPVTAAVVAKTPANEAVNQAERITQQIRAEERRIDLQNSGLSWMPWTKVGKPTQEFVQKRDPNLKALIGDGWRIDAAVYDFDHNGEADIILYFWGDCGSLGCMYKIFFDRPTKTPESFFGNELVPYKEGIMLDHGYFGL